jgi:hypothetical protein
MYQFRCGDRGPKFPQGTPPPAPPHRSRSIYRGDRQKVSMDPAKRPGRAAQLEGEIGLKSGTESTWSPE